MAAGCSKLTMGTDYGSSLGYKSDNKRRGDSHRSGVCTAVQKATGTYCTIISPGKNQITMARNRTMAPSPGPPLNGGGVRRISRLAMRMKIGTWNVRSMYETGKTHNTIQEIKRNDISVLGISEMRWPKTGKCNVDQYSVYYSGQDTAQHYNGVGFIVDKNVEKSVINFLPISDRVALLQINTRPFKLNLIQVYAPHYEHTDAAVEVFYEDVQKAVDQTKPQDVTIVMGDFNAKVGEGKDMDVVGEFGLGVRNDRGDRMVQFCQENYMTVMNTYFKLPPRRLYTWKAPGDNPDKIIRNQIDYIIIKKRFRNSITSVKTYPGADVPSDHNLLTAVINLRLKVNKPQLRTSRMDFRKLLEPEMKHQVAQDLASHFRDYNNREHETSQEKWESIKHITQNVTKTHLKSEGNQKSKNKWMTDKILEMMEERRKLKNKDTDRYKEKHKEIRREIRRAKEEWYTKECIEIENLEQKHDTFALHKKIKTTTGLGYRTNLSVLTDDSGNLVNSTEEKLNVWKEYVSKLFDDVRNAKRGERQILPGPPITKQEVEKAMARMKNGKACGPDEIPVEMLKLFNEEGMDHLIKLFNTIYESGNLPEEWLTSTFIVLPKKPTVRKCEEYRTISLMSHTLKLFLKVIHERIYRKLETRITNTQFGFRNGLGTREALFSVQVLIQRCRDTNCDVYACFVDFEKAFDKVKHDKMIDILKKTEIDESDIRIIENLYWGQKAAVRVEDRLTDEINIRRGVRQGCVLSPLLFNVYSEELFAEAFEELSEGISINGEHINNIRYADDTILLADTLEGMRTMLELLAQHGSEYGLNLNASKTKYMIISKSNHDNQQLVINNKKIQRVNHITYLGCLLNDDWDHSREIRQRIEKARSVFLRMRSVLSNNSLSLQLRRRIVSCYVYSVLLYGVESWTLTEATCKRVEAFEMWVYRRILKISWVDHITNDEVLRRIGLQSTEVLKTIKKRKLSYFGHIMRGEKYALLQLIMQGKIKGKRGPGRRRISWLKNLRQWFGMTTIELFRAAVNKVTMAMMIANVR